MNLVQDPWLPFRLQDGREQVLPITAISDPQVVDFALPRADFQGAAYQFAIGLLQTVFAPEDKGSWLDGYEQPPTATELQQAFDRAAHAFQMTGEGPLFMQDFEKLESAKSNSISGLLIEAPGENGLKHNTDHFIKRGMGQQLSLEMAAIALFTLQINAPSGGVGHRTGLRGGGPLTTLVMPPHFQSSLWQKLWLNVMSRESWPFDEPDLHSPLLFPWLGETQTSEKKGSEIYESDVHPLHMYWAMPRRIRLEVCEVETLCQLSGWQRPLGVASFRAQNYGGNYAGTWSHPLTPYKWNPKKPEEEHLSAKGQPGGITYKIWDALTLSCSPQGQRCACVVEHFYEIGDYLEEEHHGLPRLWVFGYDMDNMKARGWYSATLPLFSMPVEQQQDVLLKVQELQKLASDALWQCRSQIKSAWFDKPGDAKGDFSFIDLAFWQRTEAAFYHAVGQLISNCQNGELQLSPAQADAWLKAIRHTALDLFDEHALSELGGDRAMAKRIKARQQLTRWLFTSKPIKNFIADHHIESLKEAQ